MLRITTEEKGELMIFHLEGKLIGDWVGELERCWTRYNNPGLQRQYRIDLSEVEYADDSGTALLQRLLVKGAELHSDNPFMKCVIDRIVQPGHTARGNRGRSPQTH